MMTFIMKQAGEKKRDGERDIAAELAERKELVPDEESRTPLALATSSSTRLLS